MSERDELARAYDMEAFEDHLIEARSHVAAIQWAARRKLASDAAERLIASGWLTAHDEQVRAAERHAIASAIWADEQECNKASYKNPTDPFLNGRGVGLQRARDIAEGVLRRTPVPAEQKESICGDYPAPCNCDDPITHGGH